MMLTQLLLAFFVSVALAKDTYVVVTPTSFRPGIPLNVSVNIIHATNPVQVKADLVNQVSKASIATGNGQFTQGNPGSLEIMVPEDVPPGSYDLSVHGTGGATFTNKTVIRLESKSISLFVQTDKAMYKPGETVNFRVMAMFPNMSIYAGRYDIDVYDANSNKIKQWMGLKDASGVITNFMRLDSQPVLGDWKIKASAHGRSIEKVFTVAHYVLPKFEVTVDLPTYSLNSDDKITAKVTATYTYGKPVNGTVSLKATIQNYYAGNGEVPEVNIKQAIDGSATIEIPLQHIKTVARYFHGRTIMVQANVTESLNHVTLSGESTVTFYEHAVKLEFLKSNPKTFKPGFQYTAYLKVSQQDGTPLTGTKKDVKVTPSFAWDLSSTGTYVQHSSYVHLPVSTFTVPDSGIVSIDVDIPSNSSSVTLKVDYGTVVASTQLTKSYSPSNTYIQLFLKSSNLKSGQSASFEIKTTEHVGTNFIYQVMSRGSIVDTGSASSLTFSVPINYKMAPNARIIVYYVRTDGEVVTDSISFDVEGTFQNQVSIDFDKSKAQPGDSVNVVVNADPQSTAYLLAVDQSVMLLKSGNDITATQVVDELKTYDTITHHNYNNFGGGGIMPMDGLFGRKKRMAFFWPYYPTYYGGSDAQQIFENAGVKVMSDANVYHHNSPPMYYFEHSAGGFIFGGGFGGTSAPMPAPAGSSGSGAGTNSLVSVEKVSNVFPETWLWNNATIGY